MAPWLRWSIETMMVAPVVVKPDMASKNASDTDSGSRSMSMNGIMPNSEKTTHTSAVSRKPSRLPIDDVEGRISDSPVPAQMVNPAVMRKSSQSAS